MGEILAPWKTEEPWAHHTVTHAARCLAVDCVSTWSCKAGNRKWHRENLPSWEPHSSVIRFHWKKQPVQTL